MSHPKSDLTPPSVVSSGSLWGHKMHFYQHHIGDFIKSTFFLNNEETGIYLKLLWLYYDTEFPLPDDLDLLSIKVNARDKKDTVQWVLNTFFEKNENGTHWVNNRCETEIADYYDFIQKKKAAGKASAYKRFGNLDKHPLNTCSTDDELTNTHKPIPINQNKKATVVAPPNGVSTEVWESFLEQRKKAKAVVTDLVIKKIADEAHKIGWRLEDALSECVARGWRGFKADWIKQSYPVNKADVARTTVPGTNERDPALVKLDQDREKTAPPPPEILAKIKEVLKK